MPRTRAMFEMCAKWPESQIPKHKDRNGTVTEIQGENKFRMHQVEAEFIYI